MICYDTMYYGICMAYTYCFGTRPYGAPMRHHSRVHLQAALTGAGSAGSITDPGTDWGQDVLEWALL